MASNLHHDIESNEFVTREQLLREYTEHVRLGNIDPEEQNPYGYIMNCQSRNNGVLETMDEYFARMDRKFEDFLCDRSDEIDNAAYALLAALVGCGLDWNMGIAFAPIDAAETELQIVGYDVCRPYYCDENRIPCYRSGTCKNKICMFVGGRSPF